MSLCVRVLHPGVLILIWNSFLHFSIKTMKSFDVFLTSNCLTDLARNLISDEICVKSQVFVLYRKQSYCLSRVRKLKSVEEGTVKHGVAFEKTAINLWNIALPSVRRDNCKMKQSATFSLTIFYFKCKKLLSWRVIIIWKDKSGKQIKTWQEQNKSTKMNGWICRDSLNERNYYNV